MMKKMYFDILTDPNSLTHTPGTWPLPPALCHLWIPAPLLLLSSPWPRQESHLGHTATATVVLGPSTGCPKR